MGSLDRQFWLNHAVVARRAIPPSAAECCGGDAPVIHDGCFRCQQRQRTNEALSHWLLTVPARSDAHDAP
jgi:hypothetical protein